MKLEGTHTFPASRDTVWPMLLSPEVLASVLPGCEELEQIGENEYKGVLKIRVGPVQGKFNGIVTISDIKAPESYHISVDGKGTPGFVKGGGNLSLQAENGTTVLQYDGSAQVGGRIASVGQRLLDTSARAIIRQSLEGFDRQIQMQSQPESSGSAEDTAATSAKAPSQTEFATGVLKNMLDDFVPAEQRGDLLSKAGLVFGVIMLLAVIDNWRMNKLARKVARRLR